MTAPDEGRVSGSGGTGIYARYGSPPVPHRAVGLYCTGYGSADLWTDPFGPRTLPCHGAVFVTAGAGWFQSPALQRLHQFQAPALFWLFPGVPHIYGPESPGWTERWVLFSGTTAETFQRLGFVSPIRPVVEIADATAISALFDVVEHEFRRESAFASLRAGGAVQELIVAVQEAAIHVDRDPKDRAMANSIARLSAQALEHVDLQELAAAHGMGYSTFRRRFKEITGHTAQEHILRIRMDRAKQLLGAPGSSIAEVARAVGYTDAQYFSRLFQAREGITPSGFRSVVRPRARSREEGTTSR